MNIVRCNISNDQTNTSLFCIPNQFPTDILVSFLPTCKSLSLYVTLVAFLSTHSVIADSRSTSITTITTIHSSEFCLENIFHMYFLPSSLNTTVSVHSSLSAILLNCTHHSAVETFSQVFTY